MVKSHPLVTNYLGNNTCLKDFVYVSYDQSIVNKTIKLVNQLKKLYAGAVQSESVMICVLMKPICIDIKTVCIY